MRARGIAVRRMAVVRGRAALLEVAGKLVLIGGLRIAARLRIGIVCTRSVTVPIAVIALFQRRLVPRSRPSIRTPRRGHFRMRRCIPAEVVAARIRCCRAVGSVARLRPLVVGLLVALVVVSAAQLRRCIGLLLGHRLRRPLQARELLRQRRLCSLTVDLRRRRPILPAPLRRWNVRIEVRSRRLLGAIVLAVGSGGRGRSCRVPAAVRRMPIGVMSVCGLRIMISRRLRPHLRLGGLRLRVSVGVLRCAAISGLGGRGIGCGGVGRRRRISLLRGGDAIPRALGGSMRLRVRRPAALRVLLVADRLARLVGGARLRPSARLGARLRRRTVRPCHRLKSPCTNAAPKPENRDLSASHRGPRRLAPRAPKISPAEWRRPGRGGRPWLPYPRAV